MNYDEVIKALRKYAEKIVMEKEAKMVILFGSLAKGNYTATSDADILIISDKVSKRAIDRVSKFIDTKLPVALEPIVLKTSEVMKAIKRQERFIHEVLKNGIFLYGDKELWKKLKDLAHR
jgi:hypothetical protein